MKKLIRHVILILITAMTVFSVMPVHAELIPRESIPENTPQEAVDTAESFIKDTLIKVQNGLGYADARAETNKILFNAFLSNQTNGYSYGLLTIIANNALFEYRDLYLRSDYYAAAEEQVKVLISDLITSVETGVLSYEKAKEEAYTRIYKSVDPSYDPSEKEFVDFCYWDIPSVDSAYFNRARKLLLIAEEKYKNTVCAIQKPIYEKACIKFDYLI